MKRWALLLCLFALGCTKKSDSVKSEATMQSKPAALVVGTDAAYAPFEIENADKTISGFDIDIIKAVAEKAKLDIEIVNTPWEGLFTQLESGDRDILISAITINDDRKKVMEFSEPYFEAVQLIAVPNTSKVAKYNDLKKLKVGVQTGTTGDEVASRLLGKTNPNVKRFESTPLALQELLNGGVDAVIADNGVVNNFLKNNAQGFKTISDTSFSKEYYGIAVQKGNLDLLKKINEGLAAIKADGTYDRIYKSYFGEKK
ncbi:basic amino acid ABC transporter substrate-binding protein [Bdellovibrio sp. 22V]|uniref:basic amino acid ABC transporter substrate-binding protein n=1 Tax=Bdellovibrio TaxID=958 RepID=UPI0025439F29|nr:basic amino acid ABC transporter substrate-binding protein [Bdellovibrio sp. 22V]WII73461.1 basic amino acid ABC transporter substrate-binding protein [Bdellovibrio sp. 22V]